MEPGPIYDIPTLYKKRIEIETWQAKKNTALLG